VLCATWGPDLPYAALVEGFNFRGDKISFLVKSYGIFRLQRQRGPAALSLNSSFSQERYHDEWTADGVLYRYQDGPLDNHFNRALRAAHALQAPVVYFKGTRPGWYRPEYPAFVAEDDPATRTVLLAFGEMRGPYDEREAAPINDVDERRYVVRLVRQRIHQTQFRGAVLPAYEDRCTICNLREIRLLDAAHIIGDTEAAGLPVVRNGVSLCAIHHRAFDENLVGIAADYRVHVSRRLLDDEDGPMLDVLKGFQGATIHVPQRRTWQPDRERLASRFERFLRTG
jgi:putative restriction endonuclease